jgi:hypothetical protein
MRTYPAFLLGCSMILAAPVCADVPPSPPPRSAPRTLEAPLIVVPGAANDPQMYIRLPSQLWRQGQASAWPLRSTLLAGTGLTLTLSVAGVWLIRGGRRRRMGGSILLLMVVGLIGVSGCPPRWYDRSTGNEQLGPPVAHDDGTLKGEALLQTEDNRSVIEVVVPSEQLVSFAQSQSER